MNSHKEEYLLFNTSSNITSKTVSPNKEKYLTEKQVKDLHAIVYKIASSQKSKSI